MKIICVGRNYAEHAKELNNEVPENPVIFMKPESSLNKDNRPFFIPAFSDDIHYEVEVVVRIGKNGKHIAPQFAMDYIKDFGLGIDFTARDLQSQLKAKGLPWELAKGFDLSAVTGKFYPKEEIKNPANINFSLQKNGEVVQSGNTADMLFSFQDIISFVSKYFTLKIGDLIFTGTPKGVGRVTREDILIGYFEGEESFKIKVK
ncbi:MAG: fumarylacetoacetate hydrolase family protein [Bacteroidetes bacterium]|nr:fumarylacetoacetate hydrolase family protein [Bacteroidota bacterium]